MPACDFLEDSGRGGGPDEGLWISIVVVEVCLDSSFEFGNTFEGTAPDAFFGDAPEEAFDLIEQDDDVGVKCI